MKKRGKLLRLMLFCGIGLGSLVIIIFLCLCIYAKTHINYEADELLFEKAQRWEPTVFYADPTPSYKRRSECLHYVEVERIGNIKKAFYTKNEISKYLIDGFISVEDRSFYQHSGIDVKRTLSAAANYIFRQKKLFGASTITQQVIKNISGDNSVTLNRKLSEILRAIHIEKLYSKDEILELYLNVIPMSENVYGVGMASRAFFGKEPRELTAAEAATLIGITNAPTAYNPYNNPELCVKKRNSVLSVMYSCGVISQAEYASAISEPLDLIPRAEQSDRYNGWFVETAIDEIVGDLSKKYSLSESAARMMLLGGGYSVYTTMDIDLQNKLESYFESPQNLPSEVAYGLNYAMAVTDVRSGALVGIIGRAGQKQGNRLLNHATTPHTPASTLKPLSIYAPMIDEGIINYATVFDDVPLSFGAENNEYPHNSPNVYQGLITVKDAVRLSKNTVPIRLLRLRGARRVYNDLQARFSYSTLVESRRIDGRTFTDISESPMALGQLTDGISILSLTESFASFPADGILRRAVTYSRVTDVDGNTILENDFDGKRVFKTSTARIMNQLLSTVTEDGTGKWITLDDFVDCAGKTGTSSGNRDKLFVGYTPYYTAGIWCGYDKADIGVYSLSKNHIQIWDEVMHSVHTEVLRESEIHKSFSKEGLLYRPYCMDSGELFSDACRLDVRGCRMEWGYFTPDNAPSVSCHTHTICYYDCESKGVADPSCPKDNLVKISLIKAPGRAFPKEIYITDAEFVYFDLDEYTPRPDDPSLPYFYNAVIEEGHPGISKSKRQFNRAAKSYSTQ